MKNIAVQKGLKPIANHLSDVGYKVFEFDARQKASKEKRKLISPKDNFISFQ